MRTVLYLYRTGTIGRHAQRRPRRKSLNLIILVWCLEGELNPHEVAFDGF